MKKLKILSILVLAMLVLIACGEELQKPDAESEEPIQSMNSDPYPGTDYDKIGQVLENSTYLRGQAATFMDLTKEICKTSSPDKELSKQIQDFVEQNKKSESSEVGDFDSICKKGDNTYVIFESKGPAKLVSLWRDKKTFEFFKDENNKIVHFGSDNAVAFFPEILNGKSLIYISEKDIPVYYWTFYMLDQKTIQSTLIEQCELEFEYGAKNSFVIADKSELKCTKEYKLVN